MDSLPKTIEEYRQWYLENIPEGIEWGQCWCGCGTATRISPRTKIKRYWFKGEPRKFAPSHCKPLDEKYAVQDRGYASPCWIWTGYISVYGYGMTSERGNGTPYAHRWMYERVYGKQPSAPNHQLHHECEEKSCINPDHLKLLTRTDHRRTYNTKLNYKIAQEVRNLYSTGKYRQKDLAQRFGVSRGTVLNIIKYRIWRAPTWKDLTHKEARELDTPDMRTTSLRHPR